MTIAAHCEFAVDHDRSRAVGQGGVDEIMAVGVSASECDKEATGSDDRESY